MRINCSKKMITEKMHDEIDILYALRREYIQDLEQVGLNDEYIELNLLNDLQRIDNKLDSLYNELISLEYEEA
jgi:hypothetical protein